VAHFSELQDAILLSLLVAIVATVSAFPFALTAAWGIRRLPAPLARALNVLTLLPLVLPPVVTGYLLLLLFRPNRALGQVLADFGLQIAFNWKGAVVAAAVMAFPLMVRSISVAWQSLPDGLGEAATTLGANRLQKFRTITWPLLRPGVLAAVILGFAKALGEFGATITLAANIPGQTQTIPSAIYDLLQVPGGEEQIVLLSVISIVFAVGALLVSEIFVARYGRAASA